MARGLCHLASQIIFVGNTKPKNLDAEWLVVPESLRGISDIELMSDYFVRGNKIIAKHNNPQNYSDLRIALVSVYGVNCGISTYAEALCATLIPKVKELKVFAEIEEGATEFPYVARCWKRGRDLFDLVAALKEYNPDVIFIQHEYGPFPNARHWLSFICAISDYRTITTLHSVYNDHWDKVIVEASCPEIIVHTQSASDALVNNKKVSGSVHVIPHGCQPCTDLNKWWNIYHSEHTILQFGFGFPYKGWSNSLDVVAELKNDYPDVFFTGLMSERWPGVHAQYVRELNDYAKKIGVAENIAIIRGFQSDQVLESYFRVNRVALFPYKDNGIHSVLGCSGAARLAMTMGLPIVTSGVPLFEDIDDIVARPTDVKGWVEAIKSLFDDPKPQIEKQTKFLLDNSWEITAQRYLDLIN